MSRTVERVRRVLAILISHEAIYSPSLGDSVMSTTCQRLAIVDLPKEN